MLLRFKDLIAELLAKVYIRLKKLDNQDVSNNDEIYKADLINPNLLIK